MDSTLTQYMLVFAAGGGEKTFDGTTSATLLALRGNPVGVTRVAGPGSTAKFDSAGVGAEQDHSLHRLKPGWHGSRKICSRVVLLHACGGQNNRQHHSAGQYNAAGRGRRVARDAVSRTDCESAGHRFHLDAGDRASRDAAATAGSGAAGAADCRARGKAR
jgi:hypothetical protein